MKKYPKLGLIIGLALVILNGCNGFSGNKSRPSPNRSQIENQMRQKIKMDKAQPLSPGQQLGGKRGQSLPYPMSINKKKINQ
ncbi:MAG TPA: hypothetical protein DDW50_00680 [Firmicutes bacterium]|jgi:hypothetical protein|nr:hypothetical protein [Bacillota bacterium]